jgi:hypothetical protein
MLTPGALRALQEMTAAYESENYEAAEIAVSGLQCWIGDRRTTHAVLTQLQNHACLSANSRDGYYEINSTGRRIAKNPALAEKVYQAIRAGQPFTIVNDEIKLI